MLNKTAAIKKILWYEKYILFDGAINLLLLIFWFKLVSRLENITPINWLINDLIEVWFVVKKIDNNNIYVSNNIAYLEEWYKYDFLNKDSYKFWKILWFPNCCIKKFVDYWWIDNLDMYNCISKLSSRANCSHYLNLFEYKIFFHFPCNMNCKETIKINKKVFTILNKFYPKYFNGFFLKKTYILFSNLEWIKISNDWRYSFWSFYENTSYYENMIKQGYSLIIIWNSNVIFQKKGDKIIFDCLVFNYNKI